MGSPHRTSGTVGRRLASLAHGRSHLPPADPPRPDASQPADDERRDAAWHQAARKQREAAEAQLQQALDEAGFEKELRTRNVSAFFWSTCIFDAAYLGWTVFDRQLEPDHWTTFFFIRLAVALFGTALALGLRWSGRHNLTWEAFWVWLFACGAGIAAMLPQVGDNFLGYILGFSLILYGPGLLPFWRPLWAASNVLAIMAVASVALVIWPAQASQQDLLTGFFFVVTGAFASVAMASFKYVLARSDYMARAELARTSTQLASALDRLKAHDRMKSRFFANISHELRSPLTLILAPVQAMLASSEGGANERNLLAVEQNAERLLRLIDDLLDLSKLDAGGLRLRLTSFDLGALVEGNVERSRPAAESQDLQLELDVADDLPMVIGDEHRLEIVISNLLGNAIKYTPEGGTVRVRVLQVDGVLKVEVQDDGPGIPAEEVEQVFDRFFQSDRAQRRRVGGVGIGLALAKELVELHGGQMEVQSVEGEGSTFGFTVLQGRDHFRPEVIDRRSGVAERRVQGRPGATPGRRSTDLPPPRPAEGSDTEEDTAPILPITEPIRLERGRRARIVLAEDQPDLRRFVADLLSEDFEVAQAPDGDAAWTLIKDTHPDLILSDVMMPGRTGTTLCRDVKSDPDLRHIPVILLTALNTSDATLQAYAVGADDFVAKPFHPRVLVARVQAQLSLRALSVQLAQRERLAAVGTLAAGILHEVRNPVNALLSASRSLIEDDLDEDLRSRLLGVMADSAERIHGLTWTLDAHVRPADVGGFVMSDLREGMDATLRLLSHRMGEVEVHRDYRGERPAAAPAGPINQVFLNLLDNALKAGARTLHIRIEADRDPLLVEIRDDGSGIRPEVMARIFDPFYSTASHGEGSGLGLYLSRQIVEDAGGRLDAADNPTGGAIFRLELPGERAELLEPTT